MEASQTEMVEDELAKHTVSVEQPENDRSHGKMLLKGGFMGLGKKMSMPTVEKRRTKDKGACRMLSRPGSQAARRLRPAIQSPPTRSMWQLDLQARPGASSTYCCRPCCSLAYGRRTRTTVMPRMLMALPVLMMGGVQ